MVWKLFKNNSGNMTDWNGNKAEAPTTVKEVARSTSSSTRTNAERIAGLKKFANQRPHPTDKRQYTSWDGSTTRKPASYKADSVKIPTKAEKEEFVKSLVKGFLSTGCSQSRRNLEHKAMLEASAFNVPYSMVLDRMKRHGS